MTETQCEVRLTLPRPPSSLNTRHTAGARLSPKLGACARTLPQGAAGVASTRHATTRSVIERLSGDETAVIELLTDEPGNRITVRFNINVTDGGAPRTWAIRTTGELNW